jgi:transposase
MTLDLAVRKLIKSHYDNGAKVPEIYIFLGKSVPKSTIYRWLRHFDRTNSVEAIKQSGRPRYVRKLQLIRKVRRNVQLNKKKKSARLIARENDCSDFTVRKIIKEDLKLKPYRKIKVPALTKCHISARKSCTNWIRKNFTKTQSKKIGFTDEKMFDGDGQINPKNDVVYAISREDANDNGGTVPKHKYPFKVMVWCLLTYEGPEEVIVLPEKMRFNSEFYISNCIPVIVRDGLNKIGYGLSCNKMELRVIHQKSRLRL